LLVGCATPRPAVLAPRLGEPQPEVRHGVRIACGGEAPDALRCELDAGFRFQLRNEGKTRLSVYGERVEGLELGGECSAGDIEPGAEVPLDTSDRGVQAHLGAERREPLGGIEGPAGFLQSVSLRAVLRPETTIQPDLVQAAPFVRHAPFSGIFGVDRCELDEGGCSYRIVYLSPIGGEVALALELPDGWSASRWSHDRALGVDIATGQRAVVPGGLELALGATHLGGELQPVWRGAWEIFAPHWIAHALAVEGDFDGMLQVVPSLQLVAPGVFHVLPSLGLGGGVPLRLAPDATAGVRGLASAVVGLPDDLGGFGLGVTVVVDYFPSLPGGPTGTLFVGLGL
jgi:hypothetical protein